MKQKVALKRCLKSITATIQPLDSVLVDRVAIPS